MVADASYACGREGAESAGFAVVVGLLEVVVGADDWMIRDLPIVFELLPEPLNC